MKELIGITVATFVISMFLTASAAVSPIWLAPTNLNYPAQVNATFDPDVFENFTANLGEWATIEVATGARGLRPLSVMDSKGIIWILGGTALSGALDGSVTFYLTAVWNYNPKTDQYRYVWKTSDSSPFVARNAGELRVPSPSNHPGGIAFGTAAIDKHDNIWFYSYEFYGELWMFNTTSRMFVRQFGSSDNNGQPSVGANPGQPGEDVWPGQTDGHCLVIDSNNDLWMLSGYNTNQITNSVWHFNTTSFLWTFITGSITQINAVHNSTFYGGAWMSGCDIDDNDRVWVYGGWGATADAGTKGDYGNLWTFDTRTKREWEFEYGEKALETSPVLVSDDYNADNRPPAAEGSAMIDRRDGTLMLVPGLSFTEGTYWGGSNTVWQYSKSLKQWRLVYGNVSAAALDSPGEYTNFRAPGSSMPGYIYVAKTDGKHTNGDLYVIGGSRYQDTGDQPNRKDIWLIPQDQCVNNIHKCDVNADCIEEMIGYSCKCKDGYTGDGFVCIVAPVTRPMVPAGVPLSTSGASLIGPFVIALALAVIYL